MDRQKSGEHKDKQGKRKSGETSKSVRSSREGITIKAFLRNEWPRHQEEEAKRRKRKHKVADGGITNKRYGQPTAAANLNVEVAGEKKRIPGLR